MTLNDIKAIQPFIKGLFSKSEKVYELTFVQDPDDRWYIDMPWPGDRGNLEMVAGADDLLTYVAKGDKRVTLRVLLDEVANPETKISLTHTRSKLWGGAHYAVSNAPGFRMKEIWLCPVTLCVLGHYPKQMYFERIK